MMARQALHPATGGASNATRPFVDFNRVWLAYDDELARRGEFAVEDISLQAAEGEFIAIVGPSGCGKSTFMKLATGLRQATRGAVSINGEKVSGPLKQVGMAFQAPTLLPWRTTLDNVMLPLEIVEPYRSQLKSRRAEFEAKAKKLLATVGLFNLFAFAAGIVRFADKTTDDPVMGAIADHAFDGLAVTDPRGHVVYANAAYLAMTGAASAQEARPVERVFIGNPDVSEAVFRLLKAAREGKRQQEEVRITAAEGGQARWLRMRVRPLGQTKRYARYAVWSIADITRDRERQEDVFQELQHAIEYLDHAPCGFFSVSPEGSLVYVNATLANWLDYDLAEIASGGLKLSDVVSGDCASLLTSIVAVPGEVRTEVFDIDLKMRSGKTMPARLYHKLAFGADGKPGASRTLVISRARDERSDPERAAEVRFMRFFDHTPMAIATVDRGGAVVRANARYAKLAQSVSGDAAAAKSIFRTVSQRDRHLLIAAINQAAEGQADIPPVEVMLDGAKERFGQFFVTAVEEDERETEAAIVYMLETTERRALENQINQSQKMEMVGQLAGGIAHDFNNVLSAIMMANDFLLNAHKPTDPSFQDIMQIKQNATRAATLVRQLLAFSRRQTLRPQVLDLGDALSDLRMLLKRLIGEKVNLDVVHGRDIWPIKADVSQFEQVIVNLAGNAVRHTPPETAIEFALGVVGLPDPEPAAPRQPRR